MPAESVPARAVITRPAPRPATAGLAPLAGHVLSPPGQAARRHPDGGAAAIAHHRAPSGRRQGPMARAPGDLGPAHRHGRTSLASPRAVSAGCSRLIRTVSPDLRHSGRPRPPGTDLADHEEAGHRSLTPTHMRRIPRSARPLPWPELGQRARRTKASLCQGVPWVFFAACEVPFGRGGFTGDSWPRAILA